MYIYMCGCVYVRANINIALIGLPPMKLPTRPARIQTERAREGD